MGKDRKQLLAEMKTGIGGSEAGAVLGISQWKTPLDVYREKIGEVEIPDLSDNQSVHFGNVLEAVVANEYMDRTGNKVRRNNTLLRDKDHPFMIAHLDREVVGQNKILEIKTAMASTGWGEVGSSDIPDNYLAQVTHYLHVCDKQSADVAVLIAGRDFRVYTILREDVKALESAMVEQEAEFWARVQRKEPPAAICSRDLSNLSEKAIYIETTGDIIAMIGRRLKLKTDCAGIESTLEDIEEKIKMTIGDATGLQVDGRALVTWKKTKDSKKFNMDLFEKENPELFQKYLESKSGYRRLHFPKQRGEI